MQLIAAILGGAIALAAHGGKIGARTAVSHSPEPFSNIALSVGEDAFVVFLTWIASRQPYWATFIVLFALLVILALVQFVVRSVRALFSGAEHAVSGGISPGG
jgi:hypothetical protein